MKVVANIYESNGYLPLIYGLMKKTIPDQMDRNQFSRWGFIDGEGNFQVLYGL